MIFIHEYSGRTGNQMFQYAMARLLAYRLGCCFAVPSIPLFPELEITSSTGGFESEVPFLVRDRIELRGHFERSAFFMDHADLVMEWFPKPPFQVDRIAIHVRGGDAPILTPDISYYRGALDLLPGSIPKLIYTDDPELPLVRELGFDVSDTGPREAFNEMQRSKFIISTWSTFSWWAAFLSHAEVVQPLPVPSPRCEGRFPGDHRCLIVPGWKLVPFIDV